VSGCRETFISNLMGFRTSSIVRYPQKHRVSEIGCGIEGLVKPTVLDPVRNCSNLSLWTRNISLEAFLKVNDFRI
jgi:hypothetical protein